MLAVAIESWFDTEMARDFERALGKEIDSIWLDRKHKRRLELFVGEDFRPQPRNPVSGYPTPEWTPSDASAPLPTQP